MDWNIFVVFIAAILLNSIAVKVNSNLPVWPPHLQNNNILSNPFYTGFISSPSKYSFSLYLKPMFISWLILSLLIVFLIFISYINIILIANNAFYSDQPSLFYQAILLLLFSSFMVFIPTDTLTKVYLLKRLGNQKFINTLSEMDAPCWGRRAKSLGHDTAWIKIISVLGLLIGIIGILCVQNNYTYLTDDHIKHSAIIFTGPDSIFHKPMISTYKYKEVANFYKDSQEPASRFKNLWYIETNDQSIIVLKDLSPSQEVRILSLTGLEKVEPLPDRLK